MSLKENGVSERARVADRKSTRLIYVQILRFIAAVAVVIFHVVGTSGHYISSQPSKIFSIFCYGDKGVDLFFVISGFIIYYSTHRSVQSPMAFLLRRAERIIPIYWSITLVLAALSIIFPSGFKSIDWLNWPSILKSMFFITFVNGQMPVIYVGWSLEYEMFFYLSVSFLLLIGEVAWDIIIVTFSMLTIFHNFESVLMNENLHRFFTDPLILEFVFGIISAKLFVRKYISNIAIASVASSLIVLVMIDSSHRVILFGVPFAAILLFSAILSNKRTAPSNVEKLCARLGDASYSIYLVQAIIISGACKAFVQVLPHSLDIFIVTITTAVVISGYLVYNFVERPLLKLCRRFHSPPHVLAASVTSV